MSSLLVPVAKIEEVIVHPNADKLEIVRVLGWECVVSKNDAFKVGDRVIYFPVDTVFPQELSDKFGITKYLSKGRLRAAKLRGICSCGLVIRCPDDSWEIGRNVSDFYGVMKYDPPEVHLAGDAETWNPKLFHYTDIENIKNYPDILKDNELVYISEKIHGTCCAVGIIDGQYVASSHKSQRKRPENDDFSKSLYWLPFSDPNLKRFLDDHKDKNVVVFCEVYGDGVQDLKYGLEKGKKSYRVFDISMEYGKYVDYKIFSEICNKYEIPRVPELYVGTFNKDIVKQMTSGKSILYDSQMREGAVIKPLEERWDGIVGRVILKSISDEYLLRKDGTEFH